MWKRGGVGLMKDQIEQMIAELEAEKDRQVFQTDLASIGRISGLDTGISKLRTLLFHVEMDEIIERALAS